MNYDTMMGTQIGAKPVLIGRTVDYLRQEIAFFESRLLEMGESGDCAYERALSTVFQTLLAERRNQLASMNKSAFKAS